MDRIQEAFRSVKRKDFLPPEVADMWRRDTALPIGYGQTNSQPYTVNLMLDWLDVRPGQKVLDVGSGSGWTTALLAHIVGPKGHVYGVERIPQLLEFGKKNCQKLGIKNVSFYPAGATLGLPEKAPFDRILVSASIDELPKELLEQLKIGGKLVIPIGEDIQEIVRVDETTYDRFKHPGFVFVPLVKEY